MDFRALWNISSTLTAKLLIQISRRAPAKLKQSKPNMMQDTSALSAGCTANILLWTAASCSSEQILNFSTVCRLRLQEFKATVEQFCNNREMLSTDRIVWKNECLPYHVNALLWRKYLCLVFGQVSGHTWDTEQLCAHSQHHTSFSYNGKQQGKKKIWGWNNWVMFRSLHWKISGEQINMLLLCRAQYPSSSCNAVCLRHTEGPASTPSSGQLCTSPIAAHCCVAPAGC